VRGRGGRRLELTSAQQVAGLGLFGGGGGGGKKKRRRRVWLVGRGGKQR